MLTPTVDGPQCDPGLHPASASTQRLLSHGQSFALTLSLAAVWLAVAFLAWSGSVAEGAIRPTYTMRCLAQLLSPQGWAFFTKSPRDPFVKAYSVQADGRLLAANVADQRGLPWRGIVRGLRNRGIAIEQVSTRVPARAWHSCRGEIAPCAEVARSNPVKVHLMMADPAGFCGRIVLQKSTHVPWSYRRFYYRAKHFSSVAVLDVLCDRAPQR